MCLCFAPRHPDEVTDRRYRTGPSLVHTSLSNPWAKYRHILRSYNWPYVLLSKLFTTRNRREQCWSHCTTRVSQKILLLPRACCMFHKPRTSAWDRDLQPSLVHGLIPPLRLYPPSHEALMKSQTTSASSLKFWCPPWSSDEVLASFSVLFEVLMSSLKLWWSPGPLQHPLWQSPTRSSAQWLAAHPIHAKRSSSIPHITSFTDIPPYCSFHLQTDNLEIQN